MRRIFGILLSASLLFCASAVPVGAADPSDKCEAGKLKESAKYVSCRLKATAKGVIAGTSADFGKCTAKFPSRFNAVEAKAGGGVCPSEGDGASVGTLLEGDTDDIATLLSGGLFSRLPASGQTTSYGSGDDGDAEAGRTLAYADNGDGTISDLNTGLMWEKKILWTNTAVICSKALGSCTNPHHADNYYTWTSGDIGELTYDGTLVTIFLEQLNNRCHSDSGVPCTANGDCTGGPCGFAGYRDWRIPNIKELVSIADYGRSSPEIDPTFHAAGCGPTCAEITDPACSCTSVGAAVYHSSSSYNDNPIYVWVYGYGGGLTVGQKRHTNAARAVRGGQ